MVGRFFAFFLIFVAFALFSLNIYGIFQGMRANAIDFAELRFEDDVSYNYDEAIEEIAQLDDHTDEEKVFEINRIVSKTLAHIPWYEEADPTRFNQLVPVYENFILYLLGHFSGIPEFQKYHFTDYKRSLSRGVGICGDASMVLSQILSEKGIDSKIVSLKSHVVVEVVLGDKTFMADPDFGVVIPHKINEISVNSNLVGDYYRSLGYTEGDVKALESAFSSAPTFWDDPSHFMTNKYYFERISYVLKWLIPTLIMVIGGAMLLRTRVGSSD